MSFNPYFILFVREVCICFKFMLQLYFARSSIIFALIGAFLENGNLRNADFSKMNVTGPGSHRWYNATCIHAFLIILS